MGEKQYQIACDQRVKRSSNRPELNQKLRDIRLYHTFEKKTFYPYSYQYCEIFRKLLSEENLLFPKYHHLYIQVSDTINNAIERSIQIEDWFVYGVAQCNVEQYNNKNEEEKSKEVFELICNGLTDIFMVDRLDQSKLNNTIEKIKKNGLNTELNFKVVENKSYKLIISYYVKSLEEKSKVFFTLIDLKTNEKFRRQMFEVDFEVLFLWMQKVSVTKDKIKIVASDSIKADVYLKDLPRKQELDIIEFKKSCT